MKRSLLGLLLFFGSSTILFSQAEGPAASTSQFEVRFNTGTIQSLRKTGDSNKTEFAPASGSRLGDVILKYRRNAADWTSVNTATLDKAGLSASTPDGAQHQAVYQITNGNAVELGVKVQFTRHTDRLLWTLTLQNETTQPLEIGDLALPLTFSRMSGGKVLLKHSFISGHGSFLFWLRSDNAAPIFTMLPLENTPLEYWEGSREGGYRVFIHSALRLVFDPNH